MQTICPICLENFNFTSDNIILHCCKSEYHLKCLQQWILEKKTCPNCPCCRQDIKYNYNYSNKINNISIGIIIFIYFLLYILYFNNSNIYLISIFFFIPTLILINYLFKKIYCKYKFNIKNSTIFTKRVYNPMFDI